MMNFNMPDSRFSWEDDVRGDWRGQRHLAAAYCTFAIENTCTLSQADRSGNSYPRCMSTLRHLYNLLSKGLQLCPKVPVSGPKDMNPPDSIERVVGFTGKCISISSLILKNEETILETILGATETIHKKFAIQSRVGLYIRLMFDVLSMINLHIVKRKGMDKRCQKLCSIFLVQFIM